MQCTFETLQPVHLNGQLIEGRFEAELTEAVEALVVNRLIEPVLVEIEPREVPVWEMEHLEA